MIAKLNWDYKSNINMDILLLSNFKKPQNLEDLPDSVRKECNS